MKKSAIVSALNINNFRRCWFENSSDVAEVGGIKIMKNEEIIQEVIKYQTDTLEVLMNKAREDEIKKFITELKTLINKRELAEIDSSIYYKKEDRVSEYFINDLEDLIKKLESK